MKSKSSKTAQQMALSRAVESVKPEGGRICSDPYAREFLDPRYAILTRNRSLRWITVGAINALFIGHHYYVIARTRYIDDVLSNQFPSGLDQLVIMGAGFDSRGCRFPELRETRVFEVDHPLTQAVKKEKVAKIRGSLPDNITFVPIDFSKERIGEVLTRYEYDRNRKAFFIWEGTTPYITAEALGETLAFVSSQSGKDSSIVFDYILKSVVDGTCEFKGARREYAFMKKTSEPLIHGLERDKIGTFLDERGFHCIEDVGSEYLEEAYFKDNHGARIKQWWRIVHAAVKT